MRQSHSDPKGIKPGSSLGDPPRVAEGGEIPFSFEGQEGNVTVGTLGDPNSKRTYTPKQIRDAGGKVPLPANASGGQIVFVTMEDPPFSTFLVEVIGTE